MKNLTDIWKGEFGDSYSDRNIITPEALQARYNLWMQIFASIGRIPKTILEIGAGNGQNLLAIKQVAEEVKKKMPETDTELFAIEPNEKSRHNRCIMRFIVVITRFKYSVYIISLHQATIKNVY